MRFASSTAVPSLKSFSRTALAASLCVLLAGQPLLAAMPQHRSPTSTSMHSQQKVLHALNRLTFGPRPGDFARVSAMGVDAWFEQQLNPAAIDDSQLDARLAQFPAMQMPEAELVRRYPGPQVIRQIVRQNLPLPTDPTLRAVYADAIAFYKIQQEKKAEKAADSTNQAASMDPSGQKDPSAPKTMQPEKQVPSAELAPFETAPAHIEEVFPQEKANQIIALPPDRRLQTLLAMPAEDLARLRQSLTGRELLALGEGMSPLQKETLMALPGALRVIAAEDLQSRLLRDIYSERQVEAVMTDFWLNHFNVYLRKNQQEAYEIPAYERETIRAHALGKFEDLLVATAESPAMLTYLDNWRSIGPNSQAAARAKQMPATRPDGKPSQLASAGLNENYGRELMELHTLGVGGGYTQADVTQVAKVFTGWTIARPYQGGGFTFEDRRHEPGTKVVLGHTIREAGQQEGLEVLHILATSPATARFISTKLAVRFVSDDPPPSLIEKMSQTFLSSGGDIKAVLRTMVHAPEFWSPEVYRAKVKTPLEFVVSAARASDLQVNNALALVQSLDKLGMPLYGMQTPNGYSWKQEEWVSTGALVSRMNFSLAMSADKLPGTRTRWAQVLLDGPGARPVGFDLTAATAAKEKRLESVLLGEPVSEHTRATVLSQSADPTAVDQAAGAFDLRGAGKGRYSGGRLPRDGAAGVDDVQAGVMAGLLLGSPEFQRR